MRYWTSLTTAVVFCMAAGAVHANPIFHAPLNGNADDVVAGNNLTAYAVDDTNFPVITNTGGVTGGGYASFDGQSLLNTSFVPVTGNADRTLSLWIRTEAENGSPPNFIAGWGNVGQAARNRYDLGLQGDSQTILRNEYNMGATTSDDTEVTLTNGQWHHVVITWTGQTAAFYLNGAFVSSANLGENLVTGTDVGVTIGGDARAANNLMPEPVTPSGNSRFWEGDIDDVQIYNYVLTASEVAFLHDNPGAAIPEPASLVLLGLGGLLMLRRRRGR